MLRRGIVSRSCRAKEGSRKQLYLRKIEKNVEQHQAQKFKNSLRFRFIIVHNSQRITSFTTLEQKVFDMSLNNFRYGFLEEKNASLAVYGLDCRGRGNKKLLRSSESLLPRVIPGRFRLEPQIRKK